jgi:hypothetical protein
MEKATPHSSAPRVLAVIFMLGFSRSFVVIGHGLAAPCPKA